MYSLGALSGGYTFLLGQQYFGLKQKSLQPLIMGVGEDQNLSGMIFFFALSVSIYFPFSVVISFSLSLSFILIFVLKIIYSLPSFSLPMPIS